MLRFAFDHFQSDTLFNLLLGTRLMRAAASVVYFHRKGVFEPASKPAPVTEDAPNPQDAQSGEKRY